MAEIVENQEAPDQNEPYDLFTVPAGRIARYPSLTIYNGGSVIQNYSIAVAFAGAADSPVQYECVGWEVAPGGRATYTINKILKAGAVIRCKTNSADNSMNFSISQQVN